jgi:hypothetical protein
LTIKEWFKNRKNNLFDNTYSIHHSMRLDVLITNMYAFVKFLLNFNVLLGFKGSKNRKISIFDNLCSIHHSIHLEYVIIIDNYLFKVDIWLSYLLITRLFKKYGSTYIFMIIWRDYTKRLIYNMTWKSQVDTHLNFLWGYLIFSWTKDPVMLLKLQKKVSDLWYMLQKC